MSSLALQPWLPDLTAVRRLVLDAVSSPITKQMYGKALDDFFTWWAVQGRPPFARACVQAHRTWLEEQGYSASTINQRLAALRKLAREASLNGHLSHEAAAGVTEVPGIPQRGTRAGNWLTKEQAQALLNLPDAGTLKGTRDRAVLALLLGCGLRRGEATGLEVGSLEQRDGRCVIPDLYGKHGRLRTVPVPGWVRHAVDIWTEAAGLTNGRLLRRMSRHDQVSGPSLSPNAILSLVSAYGARLGMKLQAHDMRRTCAKLCRAAGGDLEQIQLLLGHASIQTTERYLGTRQNLADAPNDRIGLTAGPESSQ